jgi:ketosteroid isomerase-like protein
VSAENVELVRSAFAAEGVDMVEALEHMTADGMEGVGIDTGPFAEDFEVEFLNDQPGGDITPQRRGVAGMQEGWANWLEAFESYVITPEDFVDAGDEVVVLVHVRARTERDGVEVEHSPAALFQVRDGKIQRTRFFLERRGAFEAVGMEPPPEGTGASST